MTDQANVTAGTKIWKRVDGQWTGYKFQVPGSSYLDQFPGATEFEKKLSDARQPGGAWIADGNISDEPGAGFKVERVYAPSIDKDGIIVEATSEPPFGEWVELDEWPSEKD